MKSTDLEFAIKTSSFRLYLVINHPVVLGEVPLVSYKKTSVWKVSGQKVLMVWSEFIQIFYIIGSTVHLYTIEKYTFTEKQLYGISL